MRGSSHDRHEKQVKPDLSITICSWNACDDLRNCLASLRAVRDEASFEVIVVENNSEDGSGQMCAKEFPEFTLLEQSQNLGFTGGHNLARTKITGHHWFPLNSDTIVHPGALAKIAQFARENPDIGIIGPKLLNGDGTLQYSCRRFPNPVAALFRNTFLGKLFPNNKATKNYLMKDLDHNSVTDVDWVSGAAIVITEAALPAVEQFDPEFYMFCEDVDICWRAHAKGFRVVYLPTAEITHLIGRSTDKAPNRMIFRFHRSMLLFYKKHMIPKVFLPLRPFVYLAAAGALAARAGLFIVKNRMDALRRRFSK